MNLVAFPAGILVLLLGAAVARAAESPADQQHQHQHEPPSEPRSQEDARAQGHREHKMETSDPHAQHVGAKEGEPTESERQHIPPEAPQLTLQEMSKEQMTELMQMEDDAALGMVLLDQLEWREMDDESALVWDGEAWYGTDYTKAWFKTEGERVAGDYEGLAELFWDRIVARWWHVQAGVRHDFGEGPSRTWAALGVQGLAPYWFEVEATAYVGEEGRTAARLSVEYELLLTQRLILQPKLELDLYGKDDPRNGIGAGLADSELGVRLRYEIRRELAPYIGVAWTRSCGETADLVRAAGDETSDVPLVVGLRAWF